MMKPLLIAVSLLILNLLGPAGCDDVAGEVRDAFALFDTACNSRDAQTVMTMVDPKNFDRLDGLLDLARKAPRDRIARLSPLDKWEVTTMRNRLTLEQIKSFDGRAYTRHAVSQGWWASDPDDPKLTLGKVTYKSPRAYGDLLEGGEKTTIRVEFVRVNDQWMIDLDGVNEWYNEAILEFARVMGMSEDRAVLSLETSESGKSVIPEIWDYPPVK